jgi:hypothetical protein
MKLKDDITLSIADAVSDVLEGKVKKEDEFKPHMMYDPETGKGHKAEKPEDHERMKKLGYTHEKPEVEEADEPKAKGEKDFKAKHTVKKSGEKEDGSVVKEEVTISIIEAKLKAGKGKAKIDIDHEGDGIKATEKKFKVKFKKTKDGFDLSGEKKNILAYLQSKDYDMDPEDIEDLFPELMEGLENIVVKKGKFTRKVDAATAKKMKRQGWEIQEEDEDEDEEEIEEGFSKAQIKKAVEMALKSDGKMTPVAKKIEKIKKGLSSHKEVAAAFQLANEEVTEAMVEEAHAMNEAKSKMEEDKERYQKFFKSALKKFGVDSPAQLKGDKKKEADNESDVDEGIGSSIRKAAGKAKKAVKRATMSKAARSKADSDEVFRKSRQKYR